MNHRSKLREKRKLKKLHEETKNSCLGGAYYDDRKKRIVKYSLNSGSGTTKAIRRQANKRIRKQDEAYQGGEYKKAYDYWWEII